MPIDRTFFRGLFEPASFALALSRKDIGLATYLGREFNVPMPVANLAEQIAIQGMNRGWGDKDSRITFLLQEEVAAGLLTAWVELCSNASLTDHLLVRGRPTYRGGRYAHVLPQGLEY